MRSKSILTEAKQISRAVALIGLGARLQVLESETDCLTSGCCASTRKSPASRRARASCRSRPTGS
jgi:hypothetical protein